MSPILVLIGPPGAGKSTIARELSARLGVAAHDTDDAIEEATGRRIADLFVEQGEAHFRALEAAEVERALAREDGIVALGGGAPLNAETAVRLRGHRVVFLDVGIADAAGRVGFDRSRPLLGINPRATWTRLMNERRPIYESVATLIVDTAGRTPAQVADTIIEAEGLT